MNALPPLTYPALDGLALAAERGRLGPNLPVLTLTAAAIGPLLELAQLGRSGLLPAPHEAGWLNLAGAPPIITALQAGRREWTCPVTRRTGFFRDRAAWAAEDKAWVAFGLAALKAATGAGFPRKITAQFMGAIGELVSNVEEHSGRAETGIVSFHATPGQFEFVVADDGVGALASLRSSAEFSTLCDHGQALRLAIRDGVSRFGPEAKRGQGFRPIFVGLANLSGSLRFRSGDHALTIDGQKIDAMAAKTAQKARIDGFFVAVTCATHTRGAGH